MTGQQLHFLWVQAGLCMSYRQQWNMLNPEMQNRWNLLAKSLEAIK